MSQSTALERFATYKDVAGMMLKYIPKLSSSHPEVATNFEVEDVEPSDDAASFVEDLEKLGPTFIKVGQLLSTRVDLMPPEYIAALEKLQDDVDPVPYEEIETAVEEELGAKISRLFSDFTEMPLASASIGQVHRAVLRDGKTQVAVKIQRPGIRSRMVKEFDAIQEVADFLYKHTDFGKQYDIDIVINQFRTAILNELNYLAEAENLSRLGANLAEAPNLIVPAPIKDYCSSGVLTMEYIDGNKITDLSGVVMAEVNGDQLAEDLFQAYLKQVTLDGFFHADPHPGNILLTRDHKLALIDLGMVGKVSDDLRDHIVQFLGAVAEGESAKAAKVARLMGTPRDDFSPENFENVIKEIVLSRQNTVLENLKVGGLVMKVISACGKNGLRIPDAVYMIGKMLLNIDLIGEKLAPKFNPDASIRRYMTEIAQVRITSQLTGSNLVDYLTELKALFVNTPERLNRALETIADNRMALDVSGIDEEKILAGFYRVANRITVGLILSALIIGASMLMNIESKFTIFGYPGLAMIFFLIAAFGGLTLVWRIMFGKEKG
ncbi:MAG: AarF/UbiB family protein [Verrucomicrobiales bacterium]|nr:AarF/UbiB family protein [Verrucomicrobiales bacterium]